MSADNYKMSKEVQRIIELDKAWHTISDELRNFLDSPHGDFRGLSIVISSGGGYLFIAKRFGEDGSPEIIFASGTSPMDSLRRGIDSLERDSWKIDNKD